MNIISQWLNYIFFGDRTDRMIRADNKWWSEYNRKEQINNQSFQDTLQRIRIGLQ